MSEISEVVQLLARGYTREQIAAWQQACAETEAEQADAEETPRSAGRRRKA